MKEYPESILSTAAEKGYELTGEDLAEIKEQTEELSEEELGKVAGGTVTILVSVFRRFLPSA